MESIDNMGKKSLEMLARDNLTEEGKKDLGRELICAAISLALLGAGLLYSYFFPLQTTVPPILYTIAFLIQAVPIFQEAISGVIHKNMDHALEILVAIAVVSCYLTGDLILSVMIPLVLNVVHILEERSIMGGREVIEGLRKMQQGTAILIDAEGNETTVEARSLKIGDRILVKPGEGIPIDGIIVTGDTHIDQKSLTGEPLPFHAKEGNLVYAGTVNIEGQIVVEVQKEYVDTSFSKILQLLEQSEEIASSEMKIIDRFLKYYIPFVLGLAGAIALIQKDMTQAIAILVVSCPCGQMLVSSAPMIAALSVATKHGILIKNAKFIEELTEVDAVVFDKTGTLTVGDLMLVDNLPYGDADPQDVRLYAAAVASASNHPISRAVMRTVTMDGYDKTYDVKEVPGKGMVGVSADGLHTVLFGNREWVFAETSTPQDDPFAAELKIPASFVALDGKLLGVLCFNDVVRPMAKESLQELCDLEIEESVMLTGDGQTSAQAICDEVGIHTLHAKLLPEDKLEKLRAIKEDYVVMAVGDGINDALALREADIGIAMGAMGSDMAIESADIALMNNNLRNIPFVVKLARKTKRIVYQNLVLSITISLVMIALSAFGVIPAIVGSVLHNVGAFAVLINSSRILRMNRDN